MNKFQKYILDIKPGVYHLLDKQDVSHSLIG